LVELTLPTGKAALMRQISCFGLTAIFVLCSGHYTLAQEPVAPLTYPTLSQPRTITVLGQGQAIAPADLAQLKFLIADRTALNSLNDPVPDGPNLDRSPMRADRLQPIIAALVAIGIPQDAIAVQPSTVDSAELSVQISKPTRQRVQQVVLTANRAAQSNQLLVQRVGAEYRLNNCQPFENAARRAALQDAQRRIQALATAAQVTPGELLQITEFPIAGSPSAFSRCGSQVGGATNPFEQPSQSPPPYDPAAPTDVQVYSRVSLTYGLK
jgi:uncharacterized protein YggE